MTGRVECCKNPWNGECKSMDIEVYIDYKGLLKPICHKCWEKIADEDFEW